MSHTPEPWRVVERAPLMTQEIRQATDGGRSIARITDGGKGKSIEDNFNASRIVATVNAVAGITTEELEVLGLGGLAKIYADRNQNNA